MAAFTLGGDDEKGLDFRLMQNGSINLYVRRQILDEDVAWLSAHSYRAHPFDCTRWLSEADFHGDVSRDLSFPEWYGRNLHAFNDSLSDIHVPDDGGVVIVFSRYDLFAERLP